MTSGKLYMYGHILRLQTNRMSKQSKLFDFVSRNDTIKTATSNDAPAIGQAPAALKTAGKFKFSSKTSRLQQQTNTDENRSANSIEVKSNGLKAVSSANDCVVISDEDSVSPVKKVAINTIDDDLFEDFQANELTFTRASTLAKRDVETMDDLFAKYGTPKSENKASESFDIDKELSSLNSNAAIVSAKRKLDENMELLKKSPKKPAVSSKFKFNVRSKPGSSMDQSTIQSGTNSLNSTSLSSSNTNAANNHASTSVTSAYVSNGASKFSAVNTFRNESSVTNTSTSLSGNSAKNSNSYSTSFSSNSDMPTAPVSPPDCSFNVIDNSP